MGLEPNGGESFWVVKQMYESQIQDKKGHDDEMHSKSNLGTISQEFILPLHGGQWC